MQQFCIKRIINMNEMDMHLKKISLNNNADSLKKGF